MMYKLQTAAPKELNWGFSANSNRNFGAKQPKKRHVKLL